MTTPNRSNASLVERFGEQQARLAGMTFPKALAAGDRAPQFALPNARGLLVDLAELLAAGPVVLTFYRGAWCRTATRSFAACSKRFLKSKA